MVRWCLLVLLALAVSPRAAHAEDEATLEARGEDLARDGRFSEAIVAFKAADRITPRARHACLIALAYTRRELWPEAEIFIALCHNRESAKDPLPEWVGAMDDQIVQRLATAEVAPVAIDVQPADADVQLVVSSFAPDETFKPRTIHLAFGTHVITATAPGYEQIQQSIEIHDASPRAVHVVLHRPALPPVAQRPRWPWYVAGGGAAVTVTAAIYQLVAYKPARDHLEHALDPAHPDPAEYIAYEHTFDTRRDVMWTLYGIGVATVITGLALHYAHVGESVQLTAQPTRDGAVVGIEWRR